MVHFLEVLRSTTSDVHEELHAFKVFGFMDRGTFDRSEYESLMRGLFRYYASTDGRILAACREFMASPFTYAPRAPKIAHDLGLLGCAHETERLPCGHDTAPISNRAELGGLLYVIEGSTLGGANICKALRRIPEVAVSLENSYWNWCQRNGRDRWLGTLAYLEELTGNGVSPQELGEAARGAFLSMKDALIREGTR